MATTDKFISVTFLHPRGGDQYEAEISPQTTGQVALDGLLKAGFIDAPGAKGAYALQHQRTKRSLPLTASLVTSGVESGDTVAVILTNAGAGR